MIENNHEQLNWGKLKLTIICITVTVVRWIKSLYNQSLCQNFEHVRASGSTGELFCFENTVQIVQRGHFVSLIERSQFNENTPVICPKAMNHLSLFCFNNFWHNILSVFGQVFGHKNVARVCFQLFFLALYT